MPRSTQHSAINIGDRRSAPGTDITRIKKGSFVLDAASMLTNTVAEQTVTVAGLLTTDLVIINAPIGLEAGLLVSSGRVTAADTLKFRIHNQTAGTIDPASATYTYIAFRG
jgi:hypothetical protein